jgi:hypothetical protein
MRSLRAVVEEPLWEAAERIHEEAADLLREVAYYVPLEVLAQTLSMVLERVHGVEEPYFEPL